MSADLYHAIKAHDLDTLTRLLKAGHDPNELYGLHDELHEERHREFFRWSLLRIAIDEIEDGGDLEAVALLLRFGADCNLWDASRSTTPLLAALFCGHREAALMLLAAGADPNVRGSTGDVPILYCAEDGDLKMMATLLRAGAAPTIHEFALPTGMNALGHAVSRLDIDMIKLLLAAGASIDELDGDYYTARRRLPERTDDNAAQWDVAFKLLSPTSSA